MNAKVICVASAKGGSGKTSLVATFGTFLSELGKSVLLIDADFATNGLTLLYVKEVQVGGELLRGKRIKPVGFIESLDGSTATMAKVSENLHILPASYTLSADQVEVDDRVIVTVKILLEKFKSSFDYIFIDAQAGADDMAQLVMHRSISDEVVIVSEYDPMSAAGVERLKVLVKDSLTYDRTWVLLNKMLPEFAQSFSDFMSVAKYLSPIPWDAEVVRAYARRKLALHSSTASDYILSVVQTMRSLFGDAVEKELSAWIDSRAAEIRQPVEKQFLDAEYEVDVILERKSLLLKAERSKRSIGIAFLSLFFNFLVASIYLISKYAFNKSIIDLKFSDIIFILFFATLVFLIFQFFWKNYMSTKDLEISMERAKLDRRMRLLEDRIRKLDLIRSLEPEELLKHRSISQ